MGLIPYEEPFRDPAGEEPEFAPVLPLPGEPPADWDRWVEVDATLAAESAEDDEEGDLHVDYRSEGWWRGVE